MFVALYLPTRPPNMKEDPSIAGFATEKCAQDYIYTQMCTWCKEERAAALAGDKEWGEEVDFGDGIKTRYEPSEHPGCACEWDIVPEENFTEEELKAFQSKHTPLNKLLC